MRKPRKSTYVKKIKPPCDCDGWVDVQYKPQEFDLLFLLTKEGKVKKGWFTGKIFDGLKLKEEDQFIKWKNFDEGIART